MFTGEVNNCVIRTRNMATELELEEWLHPQLQRGRRVVQGMDSKLGHQAQRAEHVS